MRDLSDVPLDEAEKQVFGVDAKRRPDGTIIEQGIRWAGSSQEACAEAATRSASWPDNPVAAEPPPSPPVQRIIDLRLVHPWPDRTQ